MQQEILNKEKRRAQGVLDEATAALDRVGRELRVEREAFENDAREKRQREDEAKAPARAEELAAAIAVIDDWIHVVALYRDQSM